MATQFLIPDSARINIHMIIKIDTQMSTYSETFDVNIKTFGMDIPNQIIELFNLESTQRGGNGSINRRIYSSNIQLFLEAFELFCYENLTNKVIKGTEVVYTYVPNSKLGVFGYTSYQQDEITIQITKDEIVVFVDGKDVPEVIDEIHKSFVKNSIEFNRRTNKRINTYSIDPGYYDIKVLAQSVVSYLGQNGYKIVKVEEGQYCIDMRNDGTKEEFIPISHYVKFLQEFEFAEEPQFTLEDLFGSMSGLASAFVVDETPVIEVAASEVK